MTADMTANLTGSQQLQGRKILITGAASGIGAATAELFAAHGAQLALLDWQEDALRETALRIGAVHHVVDVSDEVLVGNAVANAARDLGGVDGVVNCAGIYFKTPLLETTMEVWQKILAVNLTGTFLICRAAAPFLLNSPASTIVNLSSAIGLTPFVDRGAYAASKGGVIAFSKVLSMELAPRIRVNVVAPGSIDTPMVQSAYGGATGVAANSDRYALKRIGKADEVAQSILFLTSEASSLITGVTLAVDGGRTFH